MRSFTVLLKNELKLNIRNMNMVIFAVILPLVVLVILGFCTGQVLLQKGLALPFWSNLLVRSVPFPSVLAV